MSTYTAITSGEVDSDSPVTDTLMSRLWNNPLAVFEGDATAPAALLPTVLLGTMTTTSGTSKTVSSLVLTPFKFLLAVWDAVAGGGAMSIGSAGVINGTTATGLVFVELSSGLAVGLTPSGAASTVQFAASGYSTASTSVSVSTTGTFSAGAVRLYGLK